MSRLWKHALLAGACMGLLAGLLWWLGGAKQRWVVYYGSALPASDFTPYDVIVFDAVGHPPLGPLREDGKQRIILGYISLGEASKDRPYEVHDLPGVRLAENPFWKGSYTIDIRRPEWQDFVLDTLLPEILNNGFDGIMIDTYDSALELEKQDPITYKGMRDAGVSFIKRIRERYPRMKIMLNRGFDILPRVAPVIDMLLVESVLADYNWDTKTSKLFPDAAYREHTKLFHEMAKLHPKLRIMTLDYWDPADKAGVKNLYNIQRQSGFIPYVSTIDLQQVYAEPK
jgi:uncharacterized protein (TIGR01370 family)